MAEKDEKKKAAHHEETDVRAHPHPAQPGRGHADSKATPAKELPGEWKGARHEDLKWRPAPPAGAPAMPSPPPARPGASPRWKPLPTPEPEPEKVPMWQALAPSTVGEHHPAPAKSDSADAKSKAAKKGKKEPEPSPAQATAPQPASVVSGGPARAIHAGDEEKQKLQVTKPVSDRDRLRSAIAEEAIRPGVVKTVDWDATKAPASPPAAAGWAPAPPGAPSTPWKPAPGGPGPSPPVGGVVESITSTLKLPPPKPIPPELIDTTGPFPVTPDDVMIDYYPVKEPYAYVLVTYNNKEKELLYRVIEPKLTPEEEKILDFVRNTMVDILDAPPEQLRGKSGEQFLREKFAEVLYDYSIVLGETDAEEAAKKDKLLYYVFRDFIGEGPIDTFSKDDLIEDISCDGPHVPVFIYHRKYESLKSNVKFKDDDQLDSFVIRMAQRAGKHVSIAEPILDATMRDGSRLQATLSHEVSSHGSSFTIRKFRTEPFTPPDLVRFGTQSAEILAYWWIAIQHGASAIYAGGTASGKTTSLNAILLFIPYQMKIVSIEDTRELSIPHPNWIAGITRSGFGARDREGRQAGEIDMFQLLKNALRQRPEYIIVGEVRGKEAYNLFQAMATGHAAYGTMHADSVDAVIHRLESDPINIPRSLLEALDIISIQIQTRVGGKRVRRTKQIAEIVGLDPHTREILTNEVFHWTPKDDSFKFSGVSYVLERIQVEKGMTSQQMKQEIENRVEVIKYMIRHNVRNYKDCGRIIAAYYKDPTAVMQRVRADLPWS